MKNAFVGNDERTKASRMAMIIAPFMAGLVMSQPEHASANTAHGVIDGKAAYRSAYTNLERSRFLQMTQVEKRIPFGQTPQYQTNVARIDGTNQNQPITFYETYSRLNGVAGYLTLQSRMFTDVGQGWMPATTVSRDVTDSLATIRSIPPLDTFLDLSVKSIFGGFVVSGYINVKRYEAKDANERLSMERLFPNHRIVGDTFEHDTVTIRRMGNRYVVTNDFSARWTKLRGVTSEIDDTTQYSYATLTVKLPDTVSGQTVTGSVYGANN